MKGDGSEQKESRRPGTGLEVLGGWGTRELVLNSAFVVRVRDEARNVARRAGSFPSEISASICFRGAGPATVRVRMSLPGASRTNLSSVIERWKKASRGVLGHRRVLAMDQKGGGKITVRFVLERDLNERGQRRAREVPVRSERNARAAATVITTVEFPMPSVMCV